MEDKLLQGNFGVDGLGDLCLEYGSSTEDQVSNNRGSALRFEGKIG